MLSSSTPWTQNPSPLYPKLSKDEHWFGLHWLHLSLKLSWSLPHSSRRAIIQRNACNCWSSESPLKLIPVLLGYDKRRTSVLCRSSDLSRWPNGTSHATEVEGFCHHAWLGKSGEWRTIRSLKLDLGCHHHHLRKNRTRNLQKYIQGPRAASM